MRTLIVNYTATGATVADANAERFALDAAIRAKLSGFGTTVDVANETIIRALMAAVATGKVTGLKVLIAEDGNIMSELDTDGRQKGAYVPAVSKIDEFCEAMMDIAPDAQRKSLVVLAGRQNA